MSQESSGKDTALPCSCEEAVERMYEFLDGELTPEVDEQIRRHLEVCARCHPAFEYERVFLRFLEQRCVIEKAPPELRRRLLDALLEEEAARWQT
ncbi:MAG TPA: mycothiol system anti-sigma-R factor [Gemmatimonadaceae bacterium]|nr:mycothiol system anti-sigma-R factor [Gemmatimonadaceae bacterium]